MSWLRCIGVWRFTAALAVAMMLCLFGEHAQAGAADVCQLQLEVFINNAPTRLIGSFTMVVGGRIAARRAELEEVGLNPQGSASPDDMIVLDELAGLSYRYEEAGQAIYIAAPDQLRATKKLDASAVPKDEIPVRTDYGAVLNYTCIPPARPNGSRAHSRLMAPRRRSTPASYTVRDTAPNGHSAQQLF